MARIVILGSASVIADKDHENTHMAVISEEGVVLIDCVGSPKVRLEQAGIDLDSITDLILTHFHPDHVSGVPLLLTNMWLGGRKKPLRIYGLHHCLERIEDVMSLYNWDKWPGFFPVAFHRLPDSEFIHVLDKGNVRFFASPMRHLVPTLGLRMENTANGKIAVYSCDTEPCPSIVRLATGADILIHEAAGAELGHSSASQAGSVAREAEVGKLVLIHYPNQDNDPEKLVKQAKETFQGDVILAEDFMEMNF